MTDVVETDIEPETHNNLGFYRGWKMCPENTWAKSFYIKYQRYRGIFHAIDDTALNGIYLECFDGTEYRETVGDEAEWGTDYPHTENCTSYTSYLTSARIRVKNY